MRTLLALFAHPDDEAFGTGGTLARYAATGSRVALVCATRGEAGEISESELATRETLGAVREDELNCSAQALGIEQVVLLGYRDSGMARTPENNHPRALVNAPAEEVNARLVGIIRSLQPQVVITFDPNGGNGHPDHVAIHRHAMVAFHAAADPARYDEKGEVWQADRLFYTAIPRSMLQRFLELLAATGVDTSDLDQMEEAGAGWEDDDIHVMLDVADHVEAKWEALNCHRSQIGPDNPFRRFPQDLVKLAISQEHFVQAWPEPRPGLKLGDLFAGL